MEPIEVELARIRQQMLSMDAETSSSAMSENAEPDDCPSCSLTGRPGMMYRLVKRHPDDLPGQLTLAACVCRRGEPYRGKTARQLAALDSDRILFAAPIWQHYAPARLSVDQFSPDVLIPVAKTLANRRGFYLWGLPGRGKTWLAAAIIHEFAQHYGRRVAGLVAGDWIEEIKATFGEDNGDTPSTKAVKSWPAQSDVLVVDDFGAEHTTAWTAATLFELVHARELASQTRHAVTIFTSNLSTGDLADRLGLQGKRIASRIEGMCDTVALVGRDRRQVSV